MSTIRQLGGSRMIFVVLSLPRPVSGPRTARNRTRMKRRRGDPGRGPGTHVEGVDEVDDDDDDDDARRPPTLVVISISLLIASRPYLVSTSKEERSAASAARRSPLVSAPSACSRLATVEAKRRSPAKLGRGA